MNQLFDDNNLKDNPMGDDTKYSRAIRVPQYTPSNEKPSFEMMYNLDKYSKLMAKINKSSVSDDEKKFLKFAATRHIVFTYSKIADYYAQADKEMQELMEESALVILDMDDAIANGYVALSDKMRQLIEEEKKRDANARDAQKVLREQRELEEKKAKEHKEEMKASNKQKKNKVEKDFMPEPVSDGENDEKD